MRLSTIFASATLGVACTGSLAQTSLFLQPPMAGGGTPRESQFWIDPAGENDSDNDAISWAPFTLAQDAEVTRVRWWGDSVPDLGFWVTFYNQDPNTTASQPDIFGAGSGPIAQWTFISPTAVNTGGLVQFTVDLPASVAFLADTRYFVSVVARQSAFYAPWRWAQGEGPGSTFWWSRGQHMYFNIAGGRALELSGIAASCGPADLDQNGVLNLDDINFFAQAFVGNDLLADLDGSGVLNLDDINVFAQAFTAGCP